MKKNCKKNDLSVAVKRLLLIGFLAGVVPQLGHMVDGGAQPLFNLIGVRLIAIAGLLAFGVGLAGGAILLFQKIRNVILPIQCQQK